MVSTIVNAQTVINISFTQYPPLKANAQTVSVEVPAEGITIGSDVSVEGGDGSYTYKWTNAAGQTLSTEKTLTIVQGGDYYLVVADGHQCQVSVHFVVTATEGIAPIQMEGVSQIRLFNTKGQLVKTTTSTADYAEGLAPGTYVLCCTYSDGSVVVRKIRQR